MKPYGVVYIKHRMQIIVLWGSFIYDYTALPLQFNDIKIYLKKLIEG